MNLLKINSINLWDEEWQNGYWRYSTGEFVSASNQMCSKNMIDVVPSSVIYIKTPATLNNNVCFYNANGSYVSGLFYDSNSSITVPSNAYKMHINFGTECGATYANNIQICLNSATEKTTYHPHWVLGLDGQGKAVTADIASLLPSRIIYLNLETASKSIQQESTNWVLYNYGSHTEFKLPANNNTKATLVASDYSTINYWSFTGDAGTNCVGLSVGGTLGVQVPKGETPKGYVLGEASS